MELGLVKIKGSYPVQESMRVIENLLVGFDMVVWVMGDSI